MSDQRVLEEHHRPRGVTTSGANASYHPTYTNDLRQIKRSGTAAAHGGDYNEQSRSKIFNLGERGSGIRPRGRIQDFYQIRQVCLANRKLFEDDQFPAQLTSLVYEQKPSMKHYEWKRPFEICAAPKLITKGISRFDVQQGQIGNCWFAAAIANISLYKNIVNLIVPQDQDFDDQYAGIFHFRFWRFGRWVDVVVDDQLPTANGKLVYLHSSDKNEFWSALLEKAYAKLYGSYQALEGGRTSEAMVDLTGGISETFILKTVKDDKETSKLFRIMKKGYDRSSIMGCSIEPDEKIIEAITPEGLVKGHAYSITKVAFVTTGEHRVRLIRIRNPWGNSYEWRGAWSDRSKEWNSISLEERHKLGLTFEYDGEFWISYEDFLNKFSDMEICHLDPDTLERGRENTEARNWVMNAIDGKWVKGVSAGGCPKFHATFKCNPVYSIKLEDPDEDDDEKNCTIIVSLMQKNRRALIRMGLDNLFIGFAIYDGCSIEKLTTEGTVNAKAFSRYSNDREVTRRFKLPPGNYCIVPSTYEPNQQGDFLLRVFSETGNNMQDLFQAIKGETLSENVCRSMVAMMDRDKSGKLGFWEFQSLLKITKIWKRVFTLYDKNNSGTLDMYELRDALQSAGFHINNNILSILAHRYAGPDGKMSFDDFLMCMVRLKGMIETFNERTDKHSSSAKFTLEEWLETTLYS